MKTTLSTIFLASVIPLISSANESQTQAQSEIKFPALGPIQGSFTSHSVDMPKRHVIKSRNPLKEMIKKIDLDERKYIVKSLIKETVSGGNVPHVISPIARYLISAAIAKSLIPEDDINDSGVDDLKTAVHNSSELEARRYFTIHTLLVMVRNNNRLAEEEKALVNASVIYAVIPELFGEENKIK